MVCVSQTVLVLMGLSLFLFGFMAGAFFGWRLAKREAA